MKKDSNKKFVWMWVRGMSHCAHQPCVTKCGGVSWCHDIIEIKFLKNPGTRYIFTILQKKRGAEKKRRKKLHAPAMNLEARLHLQHPRFQQVLVWIPLPSVKQNKIKIELTLIKRDTNQNKKNKKMNKQHNKQKLKHWIKPIPCQDVRASSCHIYQS
jgi:hypothetical protein